MSTSDPESPLDNARPPANVHDALVQHTARPRDLPSRAGCVVVGGGIMGLATAFHLAELGVEDVVVVEKSYLCSGASGRNGGGVRAQWSSETNIRLMRESQDLCAEFATRMRINVWYRKGGYLFLARSSERAEQLEASVRLQRENGLRTELVDAARVKRIAPEVDTSDLVVASYGPDDAVVFPWPFVWGYARACAKRGVGVFTHTPVTGFETDGRRVRAVVTEAGVIRTERVVLATGAWSPELASMLDLSLPNTPHRHEICSTESLKPFLRPLVADLATGLYCSQSMRGELVGGVSNARVPDGLDQRSSLRFLGLYARELTRTIPKAGGLRVLRQWGGCYDLTPDGNPIVGHTEEVEGIVLLCGFMGHGFMMAPVMGKRLAEHLVHGAHRALFERWSLERYRTGKLLSETMILG
ncbi:MAG: FAD-binding oxidoreductase [Myxococcota bacterium]